MRNKNTHLRYKTKQNAPTEAPVIKLKWGGTSLTC